MISVLVLLLELGLAVYMSRSRPTFALREDRSLEGEEPHLDFDEVRDDVARIEELLRQDRIDDAHEEACRLVERMDGYDEASRTDQRWLESRAA